DALGVYLAQQYIAKNGTKDFSKAMDIALKKALTDLGAVSFREAEAVFRAQVEGKWVEKGLPRDPIEKFRLLKRNMDATPWLLDIGGKKGKAPDWLKAPTPERTYYTVSVVDKQAGINWKDVDLAKKIADQKK